MRKLHRWLGVVAAVQLLIWTVSGLFFALLPIDDIRGAHLLEQPAAFRLGYVRLVSPSSLVRQHNELSMVSLDQIRVTQRLNIPVYLIETEQQQWVFNAETGDQLAPLTEGEAGVIASSRTGLAARSATWVTSIASGSEYRGGELPAWKIELEDPENANLWIGANSGQVKAVRTTTWRIYDFLWSLHIMNYDDRENFNSWLLKGFALLGVITILSGMVLFVVSLGRRK